MQMSIRLCEFQDKNAHKKSPQRTGGLIGTGSGIPRPQDNSNDERNHDQRSNDIDDDIHGLQRNLDLIVELAARAIGLGEFFIASFLKELLLKVTRGLPLRSAIHLSTGTPLGIAQTIAKKRHITSLRCTCVRRWQRPER